MVLFLLFVHGKMVCPLSWFLLILLQHSEIRRGAQASQHTFQISRMQIAEAEAERRKSWMIIINTDDISLLDKGYTWTTHYNN